VDELDPAGIGHFDYILFFGVLYHLRHPLLAWREFAPWRATACLSIVRRGWVGRAVRRLHNGVLRNRPSWAAQIDNCSATTKCLMAMCGRPDSPGDVEYVGEGRAGITCRRRWEAPAANPVRASLSVFGGPTIGTIEADLPRAKDEYMCLYFRSRETLTRTICARKWMASRACFGP